jgi:hypothetical protein
MADKHEVKGGKDVTFADGVTRRIRPLSIRQLRKFTKIVDKLGNTENATALSDEDIDTMVDAAQVILEKVDPALAEDRDSIEDAVDLSIFNDLMGVAMGMTSPEA